MPIRARLHDLSPRRLALIKPSALGDIVHSLPVLTALRQRFPEAHLTWVVNRAYEPLLQGPPDLDAPLAPPRRGRNRRQRAFVAGPPRPGRHAGLRAVAARRRAVGGGAALRPLP